MPKLTVKITFAPVFNLSNFAKPPAFVYFKFWAACIVANGYLELSGKLPLASIMQKSTGI